MPHQVWDHDPRQHISDRQVKWSTYLLEFTFNIQHKTDKDNTVADALSRRKHILTTMTVTIPGFE